MRRLWHKHKVVRVHEPLPEGVLYRESHHLPRWFTWPVSLIAAAAIVSWTAPLNRLEDALTVLWAFLSAIPIVLFSESFALWVEVRTDRIRFGVRPFVWHAIPIREVKDWRVYEVNRSMSGLAPYTFGGMNRQVEILELHEQNGKTYSLEGVRVHAVTRAVGEALALEQIRPKPAEVTA